MPPNISPICRKVWLTLLADTPRLQTGLAMAEPFLLIKWGWPANVKYLDLTPSFPPNPSQSPLIEKLNEPNESFGQHAL